MNNSIGNNSLLDDKEIYSVTIDRPLGCSHPDYPMMVYPVNYGYIEGIMADNGEEQEAYVIGVDMPVTEFSGKRIAVVHRNNDLGDKWVIAPENMPFTKQQIEEMVHFNEQYHDSYIEMLSDEIWDAYDRCAAKLGYTIKRSMAKSLPDGVYHIVVMVYTVMPDGRILATQRSRNKTNPLKWEVTGGSILAGETPAEGAVRELFEETGIKQPIDKLEEIYSYTDDTRHAIYYCYVTHLKSDVNIRLQLGETMDYRLLEPEAFIKLVMSDRFVASEQGRFIKHKDLMEKIL